MHRTLSLRRIWLPLLAVLGLILPFGAEASLAYPETGPPNVTPPYLYQNPPHPDDPDKQQEHEAMLALVPTDQATHVAAADGNWSKAATWQGGTIPGAGAKVWIPAGRSVVYDVESDVALKTVRVDGQVSFATGLNTRMVVDTVVVAPTGAWVMGTAGKPIAGGVTAELIFADNGPIDTTWDPLRLSRGFLGHGTVTIYGQEKTAFVPLATNPTAGTTQLTLAKTPANWRAGDRVVLTGTQYRPKVWQGPGQPKRYDGTYDEDLTISSLSGTVVTVPALAYDHLPPKPDFSVYLANFTRNVRFETQNGTAVPTQQRGHVMFMHSDKVDVNFAGFYQLGRTDKSQDLNDAELDDQGRLVPGTGLNQVGRYAVHIHRAGAGDPASTPAYVRGCAVVGSPGWGYVNHDSHVVMEDNTSYDVYGAHYVTEIGNELGVFRRNIAIKAEGREVGEKHGTNTHDLAQSGNGFWLQGRMVEVENNVAAGMDNSAFIFFHRSGIHKLKIDKEILEIPGLTKYRSTISYPAIPIRRFAHNEAFASGRGLHVIKSNPDGQKHDSRNVIEDFKSWHNREGLQIQYVSSYTFRDVHVVGDVAGKAGIGLNIARRTKNVVLDNVHVEGYPRAVQAASTFKGKWEITDILVVDSTFEGYEEFFVARNEDFPYELPYPPRHKFVSRSDNIAHPLSFQPYDDSPTALTVGEWGRPTNVTLVGLKSDSIGQTTHTSRFKGWDIYQHLKNVGHYTRPDGSKYFIIEDYVFDRATNDHIVYRQEIDIYDDFGGPDLGTPTDPPPAFDPLPSPFTYTFLPAIIQGGVAPGGDAPRVFFVEPQAGATVETPIMLEMGADNFLIEAAGAVKPNAGHLNLMINAPCVAPGQTIPDDDSHTRYEEGEVEDTLFLTPGVYTLCLQASDGLHTALDLTDEITITVEAEE